MRYCQIKISTIIYLFSSTYKQVGFIRITAIHKPYFLLAFPYRLQNYMIRLQKYCIVYAEIKLLQKNISVFILHYNLHLHKRTTGEL